PARVLELAALADDALATVERGRVFQNAEGRLVERGVDPLALTGRVAVTKRREHAERREQPRHVVGIHRRRPRWWSIRVAVDVPGAAEGRGDGRIARALIERAGLAEGGDPRHHQTRIDRVKRLPAEPPALEDTGAKVFQDDVAMGDEPSHDVLALRCA